MCEFYREYYVTRIYVEFGLTFMMLHCILMQFIEEVAKLSQLQGVFCMLLPLQPPQP